MHVDIFQLRTHYMKYFYTNLKRPHQLYTKVGDTGLKSIENY